VKKEIFCRAGKHSLDKPRFNDSMAQTGYNITRRGDVLACPECAREIFRARAKLRAEKYKKDAGL
jgi:hypothetical protein